MGAGYHFPLHGIEPVSDAIPALAGGFFTTEPPSKPLSAQHLAFNRCSEISHEGKEEWTDRQIRSC